VLVMTCIATYSETDQPRNPAASIWFQTNEEIRVLPMKTLQSQDVFLFRYQKVDQHCVRKKDIKNNKKHIFMKSCSKNTS